MPIYMNQRDGNLHLAFQRVADFQSCLSCAKSLGLKYNPEYKTWWGGMDKFHKVFETFTRFEKIEVAQGMDISAITTSKAKINVKTLDHTFQLSDLKKPPIVGKVPFQNYQIDDIKGAFTHNRYAFFHEQGLGKSFMFISTANLLEKYKGVKKILLITSASGVYNMKVEFSKFSDIPESQIAIGGVQNRRPFNDPNIRVVICSYRSFLLISDDYHKDDKNALVKDYRKCPIPFDNWLQGDEGILILDESHNVANRTSRQTKVISLASEFFEYRYLASGTPADKPEKWYSQLKLLEPSFVDNKSFSDWSANYAIIGTKWSPYAVASWIPEKLEELMNRIKPYSARRFANECLELPENIKKKIYVPFLPVHKLIYEEFIKDELDFLQAEYGRIDARTIQNRFPYMLLAVDNPEILDKEDTERKLGEHLVQRIRKFKFEKDHSKVQTLKDLIDEHEESKIIVWVAHPRTAERLAEILKEYNPLVLTGQSEVTKGMSRDEFKGSVVEQFKTKPEHRVLIAGIQVLNSSVTIIESDVQIYFDATYNFTQFEQSGSRIYRIGQNKTVRSYYLIIDESMNVAQYQNLEDKEFLNRNFFSKDFLTLADAQGLFRPKGN